MKKKRRKLWKWIGLAMIVGPIVFLAWYFLRPVVEIVPGPDTTVIMTPPDKFGLYDYETAINDHMRGNLKPEDNAMVTLTRVLGPNVNAKEPTPAEWWKSLGVAPPPVEGKYLIRDAKAFVEELEANDPPKLEKEEEEDAPLVYVEPADSIVNRMPWKAKDYPNYATFLKLNEAPLKLVAEASRKLGYYHPTVTKRTPDGHNGLLMQHVFDYPVAARSIFQILRMRAFLHLGEGRFDKALDDMRTMLQLAQKMTYSVFLFEWMIGKGMEGLVYSIIPRYLEVAKPSDAQLLELRVDLDATYTPADLKALIGMGERFIALDMVQNLRAGTLNDKGEHVPVSAGRSPKRNEVDWNEILRRLNKDYDESLKLYEDAAAGIISREELSKTVSKKSQYNMNWSRQGFTSPTTSTTLKLMNLLDLTVDRINIVERKAQMIRRIGDVGIQIELYRLLNKSYPSLLTDLQLTTPLVDVWQKNTVMYRKLEDGYLLHSFGFDGKDDFKEKFDDPKEWKDDVVFFIRR